MTETLAEVRRRLHEALDALDQRDAAIARLRHDLDAAGRRLSDEVVRRRTAEDYAAKLGEELAGGPADERVELGSRAAVKSLVRQAATDLSGAAMLVLEALWRRVPEPLRARAWAVRRRVGRG